jgi:outer membrane protein TolC
MEAFEEQLSATYLSLVSNLASVYFNVASLNKILEKQNELLIIKENILRNLEIRRNLTTETEINNAKQNIQKFSMEIESLKKNREQLLTQLTILLGENPARANELLITDLDKISKISVREVKSDVIFRRPEVKVFEKQLEKAEIDIAVARKEFLPTLTLTGGAIFNDINGGFFDLTKTIFTLLGSVSQDIFAGGRKVANLNIKKSRYQQMLEEYRNITLQSIKEVNDSLYAIRSNEELQKSSLQKIELEQKNIASNKVLLDSGLITETKYQESRQKSLAFAIENINLRTEEFIGYIALFKASGGKL